MGSIVGRVLRFLSIPALAFVACLASPALAQGYVELYLIPVLEPLGIVNHAAYGVSNDGTVVGCGQDKTYTRRIAFIYRSGAARILGYGCANRVNDVGTIAGTLESGEIVLWNATTGNATPLGIFGTVGNINNSNTLAGTLTDGAITRAFTWSAGQVTLIPVDNPAVSSTALDINASGQVVGAMSGGSYFYSNGQVQLIPSLTDAGNTYGTYAMALDDAGRVIGRTAAYHNAEAGFWYQDGVAHYFPFLFESSTYWMNNKGEMLGSGEAERMYAKTFDGRNLLRQGSTSFHDINENSWIVGSDSGAAIWIPKSAQGTAVQAQGRRDLNGDGTGDLLWTRGYDLAAWFMNGTSASGYWADGAYSYGLFTGDFNGDGRTDLLRTADSSKVVLSLASGGGFSTTTLRDYSQPYFVAGTGDFDGDGKTDILWWNPYEGYSIWLMDGAGAKAVGAVAAPAGTHVAMIGDFNGDGRADIAWMGDDGHFELSLMNGFAATPGGQIRPAGTGFVPVAVADFNGDGRMDIVWSHPDGRQSLWLMNGAAMIDSTSLVPAGTGWSVSRVADLNGDGKADLIWSHTDGSQAGWTMDGLRATDYRTFVGPGTGWQIVATADLNGDGRADLIWQKNFTTSAWIMHGLDAAQYATLLDQTYPGTWRVVP